MAKKVTRLYEQFQPEQYDLALDVDRDGMKFSGKVTIRGRKSGRPAQRLTFHQKDLKIVSAEVTQHHKTGDVPLTIKRINKQDSLDEVRLHAEGMVYPGEYTVVIEFEGKISEQMHGIYPCFFKHGGKAKTLIATQFESHHAREAFPCIDEPEAKATFDLSVTTDAEDTVLSNMPPKGSASKQGSRQTVSFETSPRMSCYLLAFVSGQMHAVSAKAADGTLVRSWSTVAQPKSHLQYANDEAVKILDFFIDYFNTPFPLPKFDQVALPDFDSLAMENWGLVTFREIGLLADPVNKSISGEQLITQVVAHELSHQWFGNLVTMKWWDDLWLNESFASIMENIAPDRLHPDWQQWEEFAIHRALSASNRDLYKDVQSVSVEVKHPDEISTLFDPAIVYAKGARVINMLYDHIGEATFRKGLKNYFKKYAYGNTGRDDLWSEFSEVSKQNVGKLMTPWLRQSGMPLLRIKRNGKSISLNQQRYLLDGEDKQSLWPIPLLADQDLGGKLILEKRADTVNYSGERLPLFNAHGTGHYVVLYEDKADRQVLHARVADRSLEPMSRINVLNDMLLLARSGEQSLVEILELVEKCEQEPRDAVWSMMARAISQAQLLTDGDKKVEGQIRVFKRTVARYWYEQLGWQDQASDDPNSLHLRTTALVLSIAGELPEALETALNLFEKAKSVEALPAEQRGLIAGVAVRFGKPADINRLMKEYKESQSSEVRDSIAGALCSTRDPEVAKKIVKWGLMPGSKVVRQQDIAYWFAYLMRNYHTREVAWRWLVSQWDYLLDLFGGGKHMEYFVWYASGPLSTPQWQKRFVDFFTPKLKDPASARNIKIGFSEIAARVALRQREEPELKKYFQKWTA